MPVKKPPNRKDTKSTGIYNTREELMEAAQNLQAEGFNYGQISKRVGVSRTTVSSLVKGDISPHLSPIHEDYVDMSLHKKLNALWRITKLSKPPKDL